MYIYHTLCDTGICISTAYTQLTSIALCHVVLVGCMRIHETTIAVHAFNSSWYSLSEWTLHNLNYWMPTCALLHADWSRCHDLEQQDLAVQAPSCQGGQPGEQASKVVCTVLLQEQSYHYDKEGWEIRLVIDRYGSISTHLTHLWLSYFLHAYTGMHKLMCSMLK